jgi:uncharacterized glyoxalase superfamily protein PhnB
MLWVENVETTVGYYVKTLGFVAGNYDPSIGWGIVIRDNIDIMFALPNDHIPFTKSTFTGSFYFNTDNVDAWWASLKDHAEIFYELENFEYGMREFAIKDCNGYILQFGQPISKE